MLKVIKKTKDLKDLKDFKFYKRMLLKVRKGKKAYEYIEARQYINNELSFYLIDNQYSKYLTKNTSGRITEDHFSYNQYTIIDKVILQDNVLLVLDIF